VRACVTGSQPKPMNPNRMKPPNDEDDDVDDDVKVEDGHVIK